MQTISLRETIGDDGILRLQLPSMPRGAEVEVVVVIQFETASAISSKSRDWIDATYGSIQDETLVAPEELPFETDRLPIE